MENQQLDVRWKQRFSNYEKALLKLLTVVENRDKDNLSDLYEKLGGTARANQLNLF